MRITFEVQKGIVQIAEFERGQVGLEGDAHIRHRRTAVENRLVVLQREGGDDLVLVVIPEADDQRDHERHDEEQQEGQRERGRLKPRRRAPLPRRCILRVSGKLD
jgi:hypothetical protein